ncbi:hypothetical protein ZIOFF_072298 [Zingiber officinale]|uniref:Malic enzyme n=1 Tax=Zingiber officinale TaxID=94328 RepID=A0A8J5EC37_ZINOF|nr:hypothetical protein ZIOFF_072298 [Zingiber officinale]
MRRVDPTSEASRRLADPPAHLTVIKSSGIGSSPLPFTPPTIDLTASTRRAWAIDPPTRPPPPSSSSPRRYAFVGSNVRSGNQSRPMEISCFLHFFPLDILPCFVLRCDELLGPLRASRRRVALPAPTTVRCQTRSGGEMNGRGISVDNTIKEIEPKFVESSDDVTRDDVDNDEQFMMPWTVSVASGYTLLRNPQHNKGLAFNEKERDAHYLRGLLPPVCISQELQEKKIMHNLRQYQVPLQRYMAIMDMQELNEKLFYKLLIDHVEELLPVVYTPTVGEACQKGRILEVLRNWPERDIQVIVVTDGERILGLGDLGCQGMGIPVGKLALYTALGGVRPSACLPVTIDVGTNNEQLLNDEFYIGLRRRRATGQAYAELLEEFMDAVKLRYGEKVLIQVDDWLQICCFLLFYVISISILSYIFLFQFEDFANHNAFELLAKYRKTHLVFNDDIQGTASVVLAGLFGALKIVGGTLAEHSFLFLGAGEAGTGIAELIALEMSKQTKAPVEETRKRIWMVDSKGLIVNSRKDSLQHFKQPWAHDHEPVNNLLAAIKAIKPTILIGSSGVGKTFTKEVVEAMTTFNEKPIILALSNPTLQSECSAEEAYAWSKGRAIFASGSPFEPVEYDGKVLVPGQSNNAYIFPGFGLGLVISGATRVHDDMLLAASEALAQQVTQENLDKGMVYPPFSNIRKISAHIAANVAAKAYELGISAVFIALRSELFLAISLTVVAKESLGLSLMVLLNLLHNDMCDSRACSLEPAGLAAPRCICYSTASEQRPQIHLSSNNSLIRPM